MHYTTPKSSDGGPNTVLLSMNIWNELGRYSYPVRVNLHKHGPHWVVDTERVCRLVFNALFVNPYLSNATAANVLTDALTTTACRYGTALQRNNPNHHYEIEKNALLNIISHVRN